MDTALFKAVKAVTVEIAAFCSMTPCSLAGIDQRCGQTCCLHLQVTQNLEASGMSVNIQTVRSHIPKSGNLHIQR